jgi:hypothetical protein
LSANHPKYRATAKIGSQVLAYLLSEKDMTALIRSVEGAAESAKAYKDNFQDLYVRYFWYATLSEERQAKRNMLDFAVDKYLYIVYSTFTSQRRGASRF